MTDIPRPNESATAIDRRDSVLATLHRDALTGLFDAASFVAMVAHRQSADDAEGQAVALIELRGLARFNDLHGWSAGDALISALARRLDRVAREDLGPQVQIARASGARFGLIAPRGTGVARMRVEARAFAAMLSEVVLAPHADILSLRAAVGTVSANDAPAAGIALVARRLAAAPALVRAIDIEAAVAGEGLTVVFQPQFAMADDVLTGAEALVRWQHARLGEVGGSVLFAAASAAGLERQLSRAVWRRALDAMASWPAALQSLRVALNITAADLADPAMADELIAMAAAAGVAPQRLTVEVTEAAIIERLDGAAMQLKQLRDAGMCAALDDFGTGFSGLSWLKQLPVDYIKIDGGFARDVGGTARDQAVLRGVIALAHALGLDVLAEGVESEEQRHLLSEIGCRWYQGFLRSRGVPSAAFQDFAAAL